MNQVFLNRKGLAFTGCVRNVSRDCTGSQWRRMRKSFRPGELSETNPKRIHQPNPKSRASEIVANLCLNLDALSLNHALDRNTSGLMPWSASTDCSSTTGHISLTWQKGLAYPWPTAQGACRGRRPHVLRRESCRAVPPCRGLCRQDLRRYQAWRSFCRAAHYIRADDQSQDRQRTCAERPAIPDGSSERAHPVRDPRGLEGR